MRSNSLQPQFIRSLSLDFHSAVKRAIDLLGATLLLLLFSPLLVILGFLVKITSPGPVLYRQKRVGRLGQEFTLLKLRTMRSGSDEAFREFLQHSPALRLEYASIQKLENDPRLTGLGRILRHFSLDELPQLWNILRGEMSLVGPRPFLPEQRLIYGPGLWSYYQMRPGLTGLWQVSGRNRLSFRERARCDFIYLQSWSIGLDLLILLNTPWVVISGKGAF
jgi:lipopolysaccharide/colanic/teichoic acid biosynthesis glycosyltransferase